MHVCDDNTFCPVHQRNDIRTYRRRRINLDISQNLRVYNLRSRGQFDYDPKIRSIYYYYYYYYYYYSSQNVA